MVGVTYHAKQLPTVADVTGTVTVWGSNANPPSVGSLTRAATDMVAPTDFRSGHNFTATISGNTAGSSTFSGTNFVLAGGQAVTLSMSTGAGAATISVNFPLGVTTPVSRHTRYGFDGNSAAIALTQGSASFRCFHIFDPITFSRVDVPVFCSPGTTSKASTAACAITSGFVIYTRDTNNSLNPIAGQTANTTYSWASNSANFSSLTGGKYVSFNIATSLPIGEYFAGWQISTNTSSVGASTVARTLSFSMSCQSIGNSAFSFDDFGTTDSQSTNSFFAGVHTNTITATNQTIAMSNISVTGTANYAANQPFIFRNL